MLPSYNMIYYLLTYLVHYLLISDWYMFSLEKEKEQKKQEKSQYAINFNINELHSIRRSDPKLAWSYVVFILKDSTTLPALHFHSGGIQSLIQNLQRYIWLTR